MNNFDKISDEDLKLRQLFALYELDMTNTGIKHKGQNWVTTEQLEEKVSQDLNLSISELAMRLNQMKKRLEGKA